MPNPTTSPGPNWNAHWYVSARAFPCAPSAVASAPVAPDDASMTPITDMMLTIPTAMNTDSMMRAPTYPSASRGKTRFATG